MRKPVLKQSDSLPRAERLKPAGRRGVDSTVLSLLLLPALLLPVLPSNSSGDSTETRAAAHLAEVTSSGDLAHAGARGTGLRGKTSILGLQEGVEAMLRREDYRAEALGTTAWYSSGRRSLRRPSFRAGAPYVGSAYRDDWIAPDKAQHVVVSALLVWGIFRLYHGELHNDRRDSRLVAAGGTAAIGIAKEVRDRFFSTRDLAADGVGIGLGIVLFTR